MEKKLQDLIQAKMPNFSKGQKRICTYITEECEKAAFMTAANLGKAVGVSESTVVRFAMELGYNGYPEMQNALRQMMIVRVKAADDSRKNTEIHQDNNCLSAYLLEDAENLHHSAEILDEKTVRVLCDCLKSCRCVYVLGFGHVAAIVEYTRSYMRLLHPNVQAVTTSCRKEIVEQLTFADTRDTALFFGFPSDDEEVCFAAQFLKSKGVKTIVFTDSNLSPVAHLGDYSLVAKTKISSFGLSLTALMSMIQGILSVLFENAESLDEK